MAKRISLFLIPLILMMSSIQASNFDPTLIVDSGSTSSSFLGGGNFELTNSQIFANIIGTCPIGYVVRGFFDDGTKNCVLDQTGSGGGGSSNLTWADITNGTVVQLTTLLGFNYYNATTIPTFLTYAQALNGTLATWSQVSNGTMMSQATYNTNYSVNDPIYRSFVGTNYTTLLACISWANATNGTLMTQATYNTNYTTLMLQSTYNSNYSSLSTFANTSANFRNFTNGTFTQGINVSAGNFSLGGRIKLAIADCTALVAGEICRNATAIYIQG